MIPLFLQLSPHNTSFSFRRSYHCLTYQTWPSLKASTRACNKGHCYALDLHKAIDHTYNSCHTCLSLQKFPDSLIKQTSEDPPETIGLSFAADILKRERQYVLILREKVTSYTKASTVHDEKQTTLREALACLATELHPLDFVCFVALRPKSTAMVIAGRSVHLTTPFPGQAWTSS